nr:uncharacterized protein LOC123278704 [Equus asinus]
MLPESHVLQGQSHLHGRQWSCGQGLKLELNSPLCHFSVFLPQDSWCCCCCHWDLQPRTLEPPPPQPLPLQAVLPGALGTPYVSVPPPVAAIRDSAPGLGRSSPAPWTVVMTSTNVDHPWRCPVEHSRIARMWMGATTAHVAQDMGSFLGQQRSETRVRTHVKVRTTRVCHPLVHEVWVHLRHFLQVTEGRLGTDLVTHPL